MIRVQEAEPVEIQRFPHPYQAAFAVASDIDSGSILRFRAIHRLFCGHDLILENSPEWRTLGLRSSSRWFDKDRGGMPGLSLNFADSFFLVGDPTTFGMYRFLTGEDRFVEDEENGENCAALVRHWIKEGEIDSWHGFLHYERRQIAPLLQQFFDWCRREKVAVPKVWFNHSYPVNPAGICPESLQPSRLLRLGRLSLRQVIGPLVGRKRLPLRYALARYDGDTPGSPYYVNDILADNGIRYVWLNMNDLYHNQIVLPEHRINGRSTILHPVTMDDGIRYWRFERCYGSMPGDLHRESYLRDSDEGCDASHLITEKNLNELCRGGGTCILYTHWTHRRSMPIGDETIGRFMLLRRRSEAGQIWVTSSAKLLEWTRRRTFLRLRVTRDGKRLNLEFEGIEDPIFGRETVSLKDLCGLAFRLRDPEAAVTVAIDGKVLSPEQIGRSGGLCWLHAAGPSEHSTVRPDFEARVA